ncbi:MAG: PAS domain-containing sensor histidine kinase [Gemmatimonadota bacterium]
MPAPTHIPLVHRIRRLPVRGKVLLTVLGTAVAVLGASTYLSFAYWRREALAAAERQALLAAASTQASLESAIRLGRMAPAHHALMSLRQAANVNRARVYGEHGEILISADAYEEGTRAVAVFLPDPRELPRTGIVRVSESGRAVRAYLPVSIPEPALLEVEFSVEPTVAAMERGARLGIGLMALSLLAVGVIVVTMFERAVVRPLHRIEVLMARDGPDTRRALPEGDDLARLEASVSRLLEEGRSAAREDRARDGLVQVGELAAEMAHEFKRPLASIQTALSLLEQEYRLDARGEEVLEVVRGQLAHFQETIQDLFSLAKPLVAHGEQVRLPEVLDEALLEASQHPGAGAIEFHRAYGPEDVRVPGDARRLCQAVVNVISNAVEAQPEGGHVTVRLARLDGGAVEISVEDRGPGMSPEQIEKALRPFYSTKPQGTGLGLPLVARILSAHGGGLAIESLPGSGTVVRLSLPPAREGTPEPTTLAAAPPTTASEAGP